MFTHDVVKEIEKVPILEYVSEDCLVWREEWTSIYSVKTWYKVWMSAQSNQRGGSVEGDWVTCGV